MGIKLKRLHTDFLLSIKLSGYRMGKKLDKDLLDACPRNAVIRFKFQNCLFHATCIVKNNDEEKWV